MSSEKDQIKTAASELTHSMAQLVRAIDAVGNDGEAADGIPEELPRALEELAARLSAARGFGS